MLMMDKDKDEDEDEDRNSDDDQIIKSPNCKLPHHAIVQSSNHSVTQ